ncbi:LysR family transcriptional regulator [Sphingobium sp.]|uniref:LysR family transcriptional regulator n=1 Tax=Sphingobium sp. TaxID=1912891 RepID=UPI0025E84B43|nr:LysR family transcriptional regulator [Sphingobium sp.]
MRFDRLDLNLLVALDALLSERSVSLAADRICLSQSATSSALGRLRDYFADELLVQKGRQMVLTARAEGLVEPVRAVLEQIRSTIAVPPPFDPATCDRTIRLMASDYVTEVLLTTAFTDLHQLAPNMRFEIQPLTEALTETLERGFVDMLITIDYAISADHPSQILFEDDYVVVGWNGNPAMAGPMTKELYFDLGHVTARFGRGRVSAFEDWFVRRQKRARRIEIIAPSFMSLPGLVIGSNRIATLHRRLASKMAEYLPLTIREAPLEIPSIREMIQWHISSNNDPAIRWIVERLGTAARAPVGPIADARIVSLDEIRQKDASHQALSAQFQSDTAAAGRNAS